jgi:hypothetical protein
MFVRVVLAAFLSIGFCQFTKADGPKTFADGPQIPILAWGGIPYDKATAERYAELANAGFNMTYNGAADADMMERLLDLGHANGVKQLISFSQLEREPEAVARRFMNHAGMGGYYLRDEPGAKLFPKLGEWARRIQSVDKKNPCYVNLFPTYGIPDQWETPTYAKYLEAFVAQVPVPMLSWDHYPVIQEGATVRLRPDYYENLEMCSAFARKANRPVWAFVLSVAHDPYPVAEISHLRVQAFSDLAYGAQVIQYFTYWTTPSGAWNFHEGPIGIDGKRTPTYDRVKQVNAEIQSLRGVFLGSKVAAVAHAGNNLPNGTSRYTPAAPVKLLETEGDGGAVVSLLERGQRRFLVVVNRDLHNKLPVKASFDASADVHAAAKDGSIKPLENSSASSSLEPGDVAVFTWIAK